MKQYKHFLFAVLCTLIFTSELFSQTNKEQISAIRNSSNSAFKSFDTQKALSYLTDDVLTTTGNGTLLSGKKALEQYISDNGASKTYFRREPKEIIVNENRGLAWESGNWDGYNPESGSDSIISGYYSAMWSKELGEWKIKSQLFVTID